MAFKRELHLLAGLQLGHSLPVSAILRGEQRDEKHQYGASKHGLGIISERLLMPEGAFRFTETGERNDVPTIAGIILASLASCALQAQSAVPSLVELREASWG